MRTTRLSSKGQVIIPKDLREAHQWEVGQELIAIDVGDGILLRTNNTFQETTLSQVAGCLKYSGEAKSLEEIEDAIRLGILEEWHDRSGHEYCG
ncbi:MAG: AbrB/MazE/SpoVT family DNA-binding domain-containing protein [Acaryochloridaceae cyanobacterium RU_4_10]|nr:AbrB/MazE/SpoVT family DNA-binding domain-containing protein [Acaryochloridaceae cyanobacterium RU_4_10]